MTHFKWLKKEIPRWVKEEIITREAGDSLISLYRNEERHSHGEGLFVLAAVCFLTGLIFICAGVWNGLSQDEQFMMALVPLVLSILIIAAILWQDRRFPSWCGFWENGVIKRSSVTHGFGRSAYFSLFTGPRPTFYGRRCFLPLRQRLPGWQAACFLPGARRRKRFASLAARPCSVFCWRVPGVPCGKAFREIGPYGFCFLSFLPLTLSCLPGWVSKSAGVF